MRRIAEAVKNVLKKIIILLVRGYQIFISPIMPGKCRFYPTCSEYAAEALRRYGPVTGLWLASARLVKCGPWHKGGFDPVPETAEIAVRKWIGRLCSKTEQTSKG